MGAANGPSVTKETGSSQASRGLATCGLGEGAQMSRLADRRDEYRGDPNGHVEWLRGSPAAGGL